MTAEVFALFLAGLIAPFLTQQLKKWFGGLEDARALWTAFGVSFALAVLAQLLTGELAVACVAGDPVGCMSSILQAAMVAFGLATLIYKAFLGKQE
jgi:peptidoglycan biosynthesis protein MviN/MurJ (putative lipid II flippase)